MVDWWCCLRWPVASCHACQRAWMQRRLARHPSCLKTASTANSALRYLSSCTSEPKSTPVCATCAASRSKRSSHSRPRVQTRLLPTAGPTLPDFCSVSTSGHRYPLDPRNPVTSRPTLHRKSLHPSLVSLHPLIGYPTTCHRFLACCVSASALLLGTATCDIVTRWRTWERGSSGRSLRPTPRCAPHFPMAGALPDAAACLCCRRTETDVRVHTDVRVLPLGVLHGPIVHG